MAINRQTTKRSVQGARPYFPEGDISKITEENEDILRSGRLILGKYTERFENAFADYLGVKHAIAINTCTSALTTALGYHIERGEEVIVPSNTFIATPNSVLENGGKVVFAEIERNTLCLDFEDVGRKINNSTGAVIPVHMLGLVCPDIDQIKKTCVVNDVVLIEDAAHAPGASLNGTKAGAFGDVGCFSFFPTKVMTTMIGGMLTTNDEDFVEYAKSTRFFGSGENLYHIVRKGNDWLMGEMNAVLGYYQLRNLDGAIELRNEIAGVYDDALCDIPGVSLFGIPDNAVHSYYKYPVYYPFKKNRDDLVKKLKNEYGVEASRVYIPCHQQPYYQEMFGFKDEDLPVTKKTLENVICLPMHTQLSEDDQEYVIQSFKKEIRQW